MIQMPRESLLSILQKEMKHDFPILSFNHQLTTKVMLSDNFRKWIFGFGMGDLFNSGFCNLGKLGRKICPVGNTRMFYLLKEKKKNRDLFFSWVAWIESWPYFGVLHPFISGKSLFPVCSGLYPKRTMTLLFTSNVLQHNTLQELS